MFSNPDPQTFHITPLGAAIVEAMPDRKMVARVKRYFNKFQCCPTSKIFDHAGVMRYYNGTITPMPEHLFRAETPSHERRRSKKQVNL